MKPGPVRRRLFVALWPDRAVRRALSTVSAPLLERCKGRPVPPANYHLTLAFIGTTTAADEDFAALAGLACTPFELVLDRWGYWRRPRVLWLGPRDCPAPLAALAAGVRDVLSQADIGIDRQEFRPHLTLARKVPVFPAVDPPEPVHWTIRSFALVESLTTADGPRYRPLRKFSGPPSAGSRHDPNHE